MKPITLSIAGLHSFREKQTVDFEALCSGGVFGIFGPTGSGKSSILDAMTLALYGKVERATNNTQGILNHAENELKVSFTFELKNAESKQRYMVERTFKRSDDIRVKSSTSRFIEIGEETVVLADKTNEVNQAIQELLGLTIDDFTRAVVLPQGKFAEFLSLKGAERRQMLQRLFNLEQYGDQLNQKIRSQLYTVKSKLDQVVAEQAGLGDASKEKLVEAEENFKNSMLLLEKREKELSEVDKLYERQRQVWEWQQEKEQLHEMLGTLKQEEQDMNEKEKAVQEAEQAEKLKPYLEGYEQAKKQLASYEQKALELQQQIQKSQEEYARANEQYEIARLQKREKEPLLLTRKTELQQAVEIEKSVQVLTTEASRLQETAGKLEKSLIDKQERKVNEQNRYERAISKQQLLKEQVKEVMVTAKYRDMVQKAYYDKQSITHVDGMLKESKQVLSMEVSELNQLTKQVEQIVQHRSTYEQKSKVLFSELERLYHTICERESEFDYLFSTCEEQLQHARNVVNEERLKTLAFQLSEQLHDGEACPVCGSVNHPNPIDFKSQQASHTENQAEQLEQHLNELREQKYQYASIKIQLEQVARELNEILDNNEEIHSDLAKIEPLGEMSTQEIASYVQQLTVELKSLHQDYLQIKEAQQKVSHQFKQVHQEEDKLRVQLERSEQSCDVKQKKVDEVAQQLQVLKEQWSNQYQELSYDDIEQLQQVLMERAEKEQDLNERIEKSVTFLEQQRQLIQTIANEVTDLERELTEATITLRNKQELLKEKQEALRKIVGEHSLSTLIEATNHQLESLTKKEDEAYKQWQYTQSAYQKMQSEQQAVEQSLKELTERFEEIETKWRDLLVRSSFETVDDVQSAFLSDKQMTHLKETIEQFWDKIKRVKADIRRVEHQLQQETLTKEQWDHTKEMRLAMQLGVKEAGEIKGAAYQTVQDVKQRHDRFCELDKQKKEHEQLYEQYQKLQSVFKGNTFVEYIAEEQLMAVSRDASSRLATLTRQRYAIEVDSQGGFIMRDDANGGVKRPVSTLSGGETFLTSLALALSLSAQIQLRGQYPLQFFFLDEGFGTLDSELLDTVITALEKLQSNNLSIGVISHVQELRARLPKRLIVEAAEPSGKGTTVAVESL
ncbi:AAA family ATPase [Metabacillus iocasae]|uniref:Nuclease SbcCD subunit C n=1 Tax=Priestia iocasae TaxID=2291674 RepID=A0ABS2QT46_9BACI|nr:SMC family ATPase [Metabacillus iocasae]MBM7702640.1 exonuclease SbcC [Metabacillus iocasae]